MQYVVLCLLGLEVPSTAGVLKGRKSDGKSGCILRYIARAYLTGTQRAYTCEPRVLYLVTLPYRLAKAHCTLVLHQNFLDCVSRERGAGRVSEATAGVLRQLASLLCLHHIDSNTGDFLEDGYMTGVRVCVCVCVCVCALVATRKGEGRAQAPTHKKTQTHALCPLNANVSRTHQQCDPVWVATVCVCVTF